MPDDLIPVESGQIVVIDRKPAEVMAEAKEAADELMKYVDATGAFLQIGKKKHLFVEAWQLLGRYYGLTAKIVSTSPVDYGSVKGFEATAEVIHAASGRVVSCAEAMCLNDEERWSKRPKYKWENNERVQVGEEAVPLFQLRSMAQTRACGKAFRNALAWIVALAGFAPTPAEEMTGNEGSAPAGGIERRMKSKYDSKCNFCGKKHIKVGDDIVCVGGKWGSEACLKTKKEEAPADSDPDQPVPTHVKQIEHLEKLFMKQDKSTQTWWQGFKDTFGGTCEGMAAYRMQTGEPLITKERYDAWRDALENGIKGGTTEEYFNKQLKGMTDI